MRVVPTGWIPHMTLVHVFIWCLPIWEASGSGLGRFRKYGAICFWTLFALHMHSVFLLFVVLAGHPGHTEDDTRAMVQPQIGVEGRERLDPRQPVLGLSAVLQHHRMARAGGDGP